MKSKQAQIDCSLIIDWASFHNEFQEKLGFFDGYGKNMDAWIDCMSDMYTNGEYKSLSNFSLNDGDEFKLILNQSSILIKNRKEIFLELCKCIGFVNKRSNSIHIIVELR